ncbi:MAG: 5'-3' exonuclease H3TH domain-containing protein [Deltaproteobacteria bacterium]|nr:5'-3' exonuclease H3TH domain-containing protein [Deltaproteobacteria bacterium]
MSTTESPPPPDSPVLTLVDGTFELFRAHFSKSSPDRKGPDGRPTKAAVGVVRRLLAWVQDAKQPATHIAVAFDNPIESFRNELFAGYKTGEGIDSDLASQFDLVEEGVAALGIVVWSMRHFEADDALATAAVRWKDACQQIRILTPDKDLGQVVDGDRVVQVDDIRDRIINEAAVTERRVAPASIPDYLALVGDTADGIPGLPGFGEKSAATLLKAYQHLEYIPNDETQWSVKIRGAVGLAATLRANRDKALLYRRLATLATDVPLPEALENLKWRGANRAALEGFCNRSNANSLMDRAFPGL